MLIEKDFSSLRWQRMLKETLKETFDVRITKFNPPSFAHSVDSNADQMQNDVGLLWWSYRGKKEWICCIPRKD